MSDETQAGAVVWVALTAARTLAPLSGWEPVFALVDGAVTGARGLDGLSAREVRRLVEWATRWDRVPPLLRDFYAANAADRRAHPALWYMVAGRARPEGAQLGFLHELWRDRLGHDPAHEVLVDTEVR